MSESELFAATAAVYNHLVTSSGAARSIDEIHQSWNEWPARQAPIDLTRAALKQLEIEGEVERIQVAGRELWRRTN